MRLIFIKNISLSEFQELLGKIEAKTLNEDIEFYYKEYIIKEKLVYLKFHKPTKEYVFCESGILGFIGSNFINYETIVGN